METTNNGMNQELRREDIQKIQNRTNQLFEIIAMCEGNEQEIQVCKNEIIELNIRLVPHVLKKYKPFGDDEFQSGCLGLILATNNFKAERGVPFVNFACFCIERELHKVHRSRSNTFEYQAGKNLSSLDELLMFTNGDEASKHDTIADDNSEQELERVLEENALTDLFDKIILPAIEEVSGRTKGQSSTVNFDIWKSLEMRYLLEMAEVDSQKARLSLSAIATELGVSTQNIRIRHQRVLDTIRAKCVECGLEV